MKHIKKLKLVAAIGFIKLASTFTAFAVQPSLDTLTPLAGKSGSTLEKYKDLGNISNLPNVTLESSIATVIKTVLMWSMAFSLVALIVTGIYFLTAQGEDEGVTKAKNMIKYLLIGILVISASYAIVTGIAKINFFQAVP